MLLSALLRRVIHVGTLEVIDADGGRHVFSGAPGPRVAVRQHSRALHHRLYFDPDLHLGEAYMDGTLTIEAGTLAEFATLVASNLRFLPADPLFAARARLSRLLRRWQQFNPAGRARKNAAHHYDLPDRLYDLFLDRDRQYSWAYFRDPGEDLETAQLDKQRHLAAKLLLKPGQRVLDIGSGWGGLALHLARAGGGEVTGITLSEEQLKAARRRAAEEGLARRVRFHLRDYRAEAGTYDRIVSVGMFEHVGVNHYDQFFAAIARLLADDGVCVVHSIGRFDGPSTTSAWVRRHIFPAAMRRRCPRRSRRSSAAASGSPMSRYCGCTMPRRCATGGSVSRPAGTGLPSTWASVSAGCGSSIWPSARRRSGTAISWCSSCNW
jgi:cyclopropane-fatty-acyl-phospholipid synthase